jgi:hypothetical protein
MGQRPDRVILQVVQRELGGGYLSRIRPSLSPPPTVGNTPDFPSLTGVKTLIVLPRKAEGLDPSLHP